MRTKTTNELLVDYEVLKSGIKRLAQDTKNMQIELNKETEKLSVLREEKIHAEKEIIKILDDAKTGAEEIYQRAKDKEAKATAKLSELQGKISDAELREKIADDLIKSNEGKERNLEASIETNKGLKEKLDKVLGLIKNVF